MRRPMCSMMLTRPFLFRMRKVSYKIYTENQNTHFVFNKLFPSIVPLYTKMWEKYGRTRQATDEYIILRMRLARWMTEATYTHSEYVLLIALPQHQWLHGSASFLRLITRCLRTNSEKFMIQND
jgi:prolyl-tRNA synthetase